MSFAAHGNWCGPGWSAGKWKDAKDLTEEDKQVEAVDALDQACKEHDIGIAEGDPLANHKFYKKAAAAGWYGLTLAQFVKIGGPSLQNYLRGGELVNNLQKARQEKQKKQERIWEAELDQKFEERMRNKRKASQELDDQREVNRNPPVDLTYEEEEETKEGEAWRDDPALAEMMDAVEENERALVLAENNMITPEQRTPVMAPTLTRQDRPLRGARPQGSLTNLLNQVDNNMGDRDVEMAPMALTGSSNSDGNVATNAQVMPKYNIPREMGFFTETRSVMLPLSIYFSVNKLDSNSPVVFKFMLNDTYDIFRYTTVTKQKFPATSTSYFPDSVSESGQYTAANYAGEDRSKGISTDMAYSIFNLTANGIKTYKPVGMNMARAVQFPTTTRTSVAPQGTSGGDPQTTGSGFFGYGDRATTGDYAMAWRNYYERNYRNRHVMKCDWKLTLESAQTGAYHRGVVLNATETITTQTQATPTIPTNKNLATVLRYKRIKENRLTCFNAQGGRTKDVISGSWSPNKNIRRDVVDDERTKVWYPTKNVNSPSPYDWKEFETLLFYNDEMSNNQNAYFNCKLDLLYHVQYRDLEEIIRYPEYSESDIPVLFVADATYPSGGFSAGNNWPGADEPSTIAEGRMFSTWATPAVDA